MTVIIRANVFPVYTDFNLEWDGIFAYKISVTI